MALQMTDYAKAFNEALVYVCVHLDMWIQKMLEVYLASMSAWATNLASELRMNDGY